jgi:hypothetical protein
MAESASAPPAPDTPRSVSSAERCATAPFCASELQKSTTTRIQNTLDVSASRTDAPATSLPRPVTTGRSRMNRATVGSPIASTITPSTRKALRQPMCRMSAAAVGGSTIAPTAPPDRTSASAVPRRRSNQLETAREYAIWAVPFPTMPRTMKVA